MFGFGKNNQQNQEEDSNGNGEMRALTPEETAEFFEEFKQTDAYKISRALRDGTYQQTYGDRQ